MNAQRPSPWLLGPTLSAFALFACAHHDALFSSLGAITILLSYLHNIQVESPGRQRWIGTATFAITAWALCMAYYGIMLSSNTAFPLPDTTYHAWFISTGGMMLVLTVVWIWHTPGYGQRKTGSILACSGLIIIAGCHRLSISFFSLNLLALCGGTTLLALFALGGGLSGGRNCTLRVQFWQILIVLGCIATISAGTLAISTGIRQLEHFLNRVLADLAQGRQYTGLLGIGESMHIQHRQRITLSRRIVATIDGAMSPGYLRTQVLTTYRNQRWTADAVPPQMLVGTWIPHAQSESTPMLHGQRWYHTDTASSSHQAGHPTHPVESSKWQHVSLKVNLRGIVPLPYTTKRVGISANLSCVRNAGDLLDCTPPAKLTHYTVEHAQMPVPITYGIGNALRPLAIASQQQDSPLHRAIAVPTAVAEPLRPLARRIVGPAQTPPLQAAQKIQQYFRRHYTYALDVKLARDGDPIVDFVLNRRPAYCEYFASGMVLLLRTLGVPARIVSGFAVWEYNPIAAQWIVRQRDAHAWVEVYDDANSRWVAFDATPPYTASRLNGRDTRRWLDQSIAWIELRLPDALATIGRLHPKHWFDQLASIRWPRFGWPSGLLALAGAIGGILVIIKRGKSIKARRQRDRHRKDDHILTAARAEAQLQFEQVAKTLQRCGMPIHPAETMAEYLARFTSQSNTGQTPESAALRLALRTFAAAYADLRFGPVQQNTETTRECLAVLGEMAREINTTLSLQAAIKSKAPQTIPEP